MHSNISKIRERLGMSSQHFLCYCCSDGNHGCHSAFCQSRIAFFIFSCSIDIVIVNEKAEHSSVCIGQFRVRKIFTFKRG